MFSPGSLLELWRYPIGDALLFSSRTKRQMSNTARREIGDRRREDYRRTEDNRATVPAITEQRLIDGPGLPRISNEEFSIYLVHVVKNSPCPVCVQALLKDEDDGLRV